MGSVLRLAAMFLALGAFGLTHALLGGLALRRRASVG